MTLRIFSKIPPQIYDLALLFKKHNFRLFLVGGSVRDCFLGKIPSDFDFCTNATPSDIKAILCNYRLITIGEKYGTIGLHIDGIAFEITTFRSECKYDDNRHPSEVTFESDIMQDLQRRDFSINAMAYDLLDKKIIDLFNGTNDLKNKTIRAVGEAKMRFSEDALRILRAFSLVARFGFTIEITTMEAILSQKYLLDNILKERIQAEIIKILQGRFALKALKLMQKNDIFHIQIPKNFSKIPHHYRKYAIFLIDENLAKALANRDSNAIKSIFYHLTLKRKITQRTLLLSDLSLRFNQNHIKIALSLHKKGSLLKKGFVLKDIKINGFDLQKIGFHNKEIAIIKKELLTQVYSKNIRNDRKILIKKAREIKRLQ